MFTIEECVSEVHQHFEGCLLLVFKSELISNYHRSYQLQVMFTGTVHYSHLFNLVIDIHLQITLFYNSEVNLPAVGSFFSVEQAGDIALSRDDVDKIQSSDLFKQACFGCISSHVCKSVHLCCSKNFMFTKNVSAMVISVIERV